MAYQHDAAICQRYLLFNVVHLPVVTDLVMLYPREFGIAFYCLGRDNDGVPELQLVPVAAHMLV
ncbi:MAG: hypothetical protein K0R82_615 [Flavipsychrobacter sp.]|nr:hypothetical protein [Flavipsychrobacter sp.]